MIRVTSFFRDKETFETLAAKVIPRLFAGKDADASVRVWVPGCATGEEAYSLAILLREADGPFQRRPQGSGVWHGHRRVRPSPPPAWDAIRRRCWRVCHDGRRDRFFRLSQGSYVVSKEIRELCTFSTHNLVRDPPFSRMELVSCRNLLIYLDRTLQAAVIPVFHYSLARGGILLLGGSESIAAHE